MRDIPFTPCNKVCCPLQKKCSPHFLKQMALLKELDIIEIKLDILKRKREILDIRNAGQGDYDALTIERLSLKDMHEKLQGEYMHILTRNIVYALTADGDNQLVEILLNDAEKEIEKIKTKHKEKEAEREKFLAGVDEYLKRGEE